MEPDTCPICEREPLVLTLEVEAGACQGCQQRAAIIGCAVEDLCRTCRKSEGGDDGTGRIECDSCMAEALAARAEAVAAD